MKLELHRAATLELEEAFDWYRQQDAEVAERFLEAVRAQVERASRFPSSGAPISGIPEEWAARRFAVKRFPYSVIVAPAEDRLMVFAIAHARRRPGYWTERLGT